MRILNSVAGLNEVFGGPSRSVPALCNACAPRVEWLGLATQRFVALESPMLRPSANIELFEWPAFYAKPLRTALPLFRGATALAQLRERHVTLVHDHGAWQPFNQTMAWVAGQLDVPRVHSPRGMLMQWPMSKSRARKAVMMRLGQRRALETVRAFVATSEEEALDLRRLGLRQPVAVIPNGVQLPGSAESGGADRPPVVAFLSRVHPKKGLLNLVRAWAIAKPAGWRLEIAGPDELGHAEEVRREVANLGLQGVVEVRPGIEDANKFDFLGRCRIAILPSESENFGMMVAEALAVGTPVIASTGTPWSSLTAQGCGWWIPNSVERLAATLTEATGRPAAELAEMGRRGRSHVLREFGWDSVGERTVRLYSWILGRGDRPEFVEEG